MNIGFPRDARLTSAKKTFILDCKAAHLTRKTLRANRDVLTAFVNFVGDIAVKELTPDHVRLYITHLAERPRRHDGNKVSSRSLARHYAVIRTWIRWLYAQKLIEQRIVDLAKSPRLAKSIPPVRRGDHGIAFFTQDCFHRADRLGAH